MPRQQVIRAVVIDDYDAFADSLTRILNKERDIEVIGEAANCAEAIELTQRLQPDVAVLDHDLPDGDGVSVAKSIRILSPKTRIVMLTGRGDDQTVGAAIDAGCSGYVTKVRAVWELVSAVRLVQSGETYLSPDVLAALMLRVQGSSTLSQQERDILQLMADGLEDKLIAKELSLSLRVVRKGVRNALVTLGPAQAR